MTVPSARLVVLISGNGSNLQAILDACAAGKIPAHVVAVFSNQPGAYGLERARLAGVPAHVASKPKSQDRREYDSELALRVAACQPEWIILAGWMRVLSANFLNAFPHRVVNLHPALPGAFPGTHSIERALEAFQRHEIDHTGVMVHLVPDEGVDSGPTVAQEIVPILPEDTLESLETRIHTVEHRILIEAIQSLLAR